MTPQVLNKPIPVQYHKGILKILVNLPFAEGEKFNIEIIKPKKTIKKIDYSTLEKVAEKSYGILKDENWTKLRKTFNKNIDSRINKLWHVSG